MNPPAVQMIPVDNIVDPTWNSRTIKFQPEGDDADFVRSIKTEGIKQPIKVRLVSVSDTSPPVAKYRLVFGSRRLAGARAAGLKEVPAMVEPSGDVNKAGVQDAIDNVIENVGRRDLTTYEQARAFSQLRDLGVSNDEVCKRVGVSKSYTSKLVTCYNRLAPEIVTAWSKGEPATDVSFLHELTAIDDKVKQVDAYKARKSQLAEIEQAVNTGADDIDEEEEEEGDKPLGKDMKRTYSVSKDRVKVLRAALKKAKAPVLTLGVIEFLIGNTDVIKGVIDVSKTEGKD